MGILFDWFLGKTVDELKGMRAKRIELLTKETEAGKVEHLVDEIKAIDAELEKHEEEK